MWTRCLRQSGNGNTGGGEGKAGLGRAWGRAWGLGVERWVVVKARGTGQPNSGDREYIKKVGDDGERNGYVFLAVN